MHVFTVIQRNLLYNVMYTCRHVIMLFLNTIESFDLTCVYVQTSTFSSDIYVGMCRHILLRVPYVYTRTDINYFHFVL